MSKTIIPLLEQYPGNYPFRLAELQEMIQEVSAELHWRPIVYAKKVANPSDQMTQRTMDIKIARMKLVKVLIQQKIEELTPGQQTSLF